MKLLKDLGVQGPQVIVNERLILLSCMQLEVSKLISPKINPTTYNFPSGTYMYSKSIAHKIDLD